MFLIKGIIIGFSIAAPVGPIGLLCIQRTLNSGKLSGFISGVGAATTDAIYGIMAAFSITLISGFLLNQQDWLKLFGGLFLAYLGINIFISRNKEKNDIEEIKKKNSLFKDYFSTFLLTITNPMTILSFLAVFASLNVITSGHKNISALFLVTGVFIGSMLWWLVLSSFANLFKTRIDLKYVNIASAIIITGFGFLAIQNAITKMFPLFLQ